MPGFIVTKAATVQCMHQAKCEPTPLAPRVKIDGQPVVLFLSTPQYTIASCPNPTPSASNGPCKTAAFNSKSASVMAGGVPVLLSDGSTATCAPNAATASIMMTQTRANAK